MGGVLDMHDRDMFRGCARHQERCCARHVEHGHARHMLSMVALGLCSKSCSLVEGDKSCMRICRACDSCSSGVNSASFVGAVAELEGFTSRFHFRGGACSAWEVRPLAFVEDVLAPLDALDLERRINPTMVK
ncbi:hypothetical protein A2U01_0000473 [Trifolium medium]|uniref:Uncharacterized protein n=1 Tax=Trifolium medium TaxID=97028 RepID=A0A392LXR5_9FABA|nr:hypothetical protein [Trifolium medium]